jgi:probable F420-dependent oxidoreductase
MSDEIAVGTQFWPQHAPFDDLRVGWREAEQLGVDSIWTWDHFFPIAAGPQGDERHHEAWTLLAAAAALTERPQLGVLVSSIHYRNPDLLAHMATTADHVAGGRVVLGLGAGWYQRDYEEYGYEFRDGPARLRDLRAGVERIRARLDQLDPPPVGPLPLLIGGRGEQLALRIVAEHADWWNTFGPVDEWRHKNEVLDRHCDEVGRDSSEIVRTVLIRDDEVDDLGAYVDAGVQHIIVQTPHPYDLGPTARIIHELRG